MPLYNNEADVARAIRSVLAQTVRSFEFLIVNDGSTDRGPEIIRSMHDPRIHVIDQENAGVSAARNRGIKEAKSELIAFLDADDEWKEDFLETVLKLQRKFPDCAVYATNYEFCSINNHIRHTIIRGLPEEFTEGMLDNYFKIASLSNPPLCSSAIVVQKTAIESIGGFHLGVVAGEDLLTWARLAVKYKIAYTTEPKAFFWQPKQLPDRPKRFPAESDIVGQQLAGLLEIIESSKKDDLKKYIALWHKMRAVIFIRMGENKKALKEIQKALSYRRISIRLIVLLLIAILPSRCSKQIFAYFKKLKEESSFLKI